MNVQVKVGLEKREHPERFCKEPGCLWRVVELDHSTQTYQPLSGCSDGWCPRHRRRVPPSWIQRVDE